MMLLNGINFLTINFAIKKNAKLNLYYNHITICNNRTYSHIIILINVEYVNNNFVVYVGQNMLEHVILINCF